MTPETQRFYEFGDFRIDLREKILLRSGVTVAVTPKMFETLCVLIESAGRTVEKDELMRRIWEDRFVEESNLTFNVGMLRKALGDDAAKPKFIETVPRRGYRFIAEVTRADDGDFKANGSGAVKLSEKLAATANDATLTGAGSLNEKSVAIPSKISSHFRARPIFYSLLAILIGVGLLTGFYLLRKPPTLFQKFDKSGAAFLSVEKLSDSGNLSGLNISRDGKMLVYLTSETGKNTIWLRQFATGKIVPLLASADETFSAANFSDEGEYIFYTHARRGEPLTLSRVSTLGGAPTHIVRGLHSGWSFSPDERQVAFAHYDEQGSHLLTADADGNNEREIFLSPKPRYMFSLAWSPDGKSIAYCVGNGRYDGGGADSSPFAYNLETGANAPLTEFKWNYLKNIEWLPDASGVLLTAREKAEDATQIRRVSLADGRAARITNDSNSLNLGGASADLSGIAATQSYVNSTVYVAPSDDAAKARPIGKAEFDVDWTPDGKIVFAARETTETDIWEMNADGAEKRQLTVNDSLERYATASPDGKYVVYVSNRGGRQNVWRMDAGGGENQIALTSGDGESQPTVTPDSRFVVFNRIEDGSLWRVPMEGGEPSRVSEEKTQRTAVSPDGGKIAYFGRGRDGGERRKLLVKSFPDGALLNEFDASTTLAAPRVAWSRDGKFLIYNNQDSSHVGNLWRQSLAGGDAQKITDFAAEQIFDFSFSPDGCFLALVRGSWNFDAVLLKGFE